MLIKPYTATWINDFEAIRLEIDRGMKGLVYGIEHVGSTAVPELDSKPIIDIDIIYKDGQAFQKIKAALLSIGYYHNGNQGIENRAVFKRNKNSSTSVLDTIAHHLYACPKGSEPLQRHLLMRDYLRKNDGARKQYQDMKYEWAQKANQDRKQYQVLKELHVNGFIDGLVEKERGRRR